MRSGKWLGVVSLSAAIAGCSGEEADNVGAGEPVTQFRSALTGTDILGFEDPNGWSATQGTRTATASRVQGNAALELAGITYTEISSANLATLSGVTSTLAYDLRIPTEQPNPDWYGFAQLFVSIPSQGIYNQSLGQKDLKTFPVGIFKRASYDVPANVVTKLKAAYSDLTIKIVLNVPAGPGVYRLDAVRFVADTDIDVTRISLTPAINYDATPNVPAQGAAVTWVGSIRNRGTKDLGSFAYKWLVNGQQVATGTVPSLAAGATTTVSLPRSWTNTVTDITLTADPSNVIAEASEGNNSRTIRNNALMAGLWVERSVYNFFDEHQLEFQATYGINDGANSWEDWAQRQMTRWNQLFAAAVYPLSAPQGGLDRVRLEKVTVVDDGALPLHGGASTNDPDMTDKTVDMMWGFVASQIRNDPGFYDPTNPGNPFNHEPSLTHEMTHARFLVDSYWQDVGSNDIDVLDDTGNLLFPHDGSIAHYVSTGPSLMASTGTFYAEWEIDWLNNYARQRPLPGWANYNPHNGTWTYFHTTPRKMPADNVLRILGANGQPLAGARVRLYKAVLLPDFQKNIPNTASVDLVAGVDGKVSIGGQPFSIDNLTIDGGMSAACIDLIRVTKGAGSATRFLDLAQVHVAYFQGKTGTAVYDVATGL